MLPWAVEFIALHWTALANDLARCDSAETTEVVEKEAFLAAGRKMRPAPSAVRTSHVVQPSNRCF